MTDARNGDGPSLETYVETRFNILQEETKQIAEQLRREALLIRDEINRHFELKRQHISVLEGSIADRFIEIDKRYEQRFLAQQEALATALHEVESRRQDNTVLTTARFEAADRLLAQMQTAMREAIEKAERATELRFDSVNEFRQTLTDQAATFMTRPAFEEAQKAAIASREGINARVEALQTRMNLREGEVGGSRERRGETRATLSTLVAVGAVVVSVILGGFQLLNPAPSRMQQQAAVTIPPGYQLVPVPPIVIK